MSSGSASEAADRRDMTTLGDRLLGHVVACSGARATIAAIIENGATDLTERWSVGRLISISVGRNRVVALVDSMQTDNKAWSSDVDNVFRVEVELLGEVAVEEDGSENFTTGISTYPHLGAIAHRIRKGDLRQIYKNRNGESQVVGTLSQDSTIDASVHVPSMLSKHFAIVGSTGVGKSSAVSLLLRSAVASDPKLRILILDPHNEFAAAFQDLSAVIDPERLDLPFWLMRLEEFAEVIFRGRVPVPEEIDVLRDLIPEAKKAFRGESSLMRRQTERSSLTADTPVPYRISDLLALIDDRIGKLEGRAEKPHLRSLKLRVVAAINDPRYRFMFSSNTINDTIMETIQTIFRIPGDGKPITVFQLSGIPSEVVNSVASVLTRMAFEIGLWSNGAVHVLVVCEEAHRYVPADPSLGFFPTRQAIARIAKEGRKYGVSLGIVTQRPGDLDQTILSQCSTVFTMRLTNDRDQEIIRSAIPESSMSATSFISSLGNGEAIAFGEAVSVAMRMKFNRLPTTYLPKTLSSEVAEVEDSGDTINLRNIISHMRQLSTQPDISGFQESYEEGQRRMLEQMPSLDDAEQNLEPYKADMLPGRAADEASEPARYPLQQPRSDAGAFNRQSTEAASAATIRRDPNRPSSLRESLLKKPLSSLYNKD
jgi:uncharacterized protein